MVRLLTLDIQIILKIIYYLGYFSLFLFDGLEAVFFSTQQEVPISNLRTLGLKNIGFCLLKMFNCENVKENTSQIPIFSVGLFNWTWYFLLILYSCHEKDNVP